LLYEDGKETVYLEYAQKHVGIVEQLIEEDTKWDLLNGNAGAVQVLLMLYETIPNKLYLDLAERAMNVLEKGAKEQGQGIGWVIEKAIPPMSGLAHGNSGLLMALIHLWRLTSKRKYEQLAEKVWAYEESLYNPKINNWIDVRVENCEADDIGAVAWCHGAAGILYSRVRCYKYAEGIKWKRRFEIDMHRAYRKLKEYWKRDSWCLCHGICGNLWILEKAEGILEGEKVTYSDYFEREEVHLLPQEKVNPGLLNGY